MSLQRKGVAATEGQSVEELEALEQAYEDLVEAMGWAREETGFRFEPPTPLTLDVMERYAGALSRVGEAVGRAETCARDYVEQEYIPRVPRKAAIRAAIPDLLDRLMEGTWGTGSYVEDDLWFLRRALDLGSTSTGVSTSSAGPSAQAKTRPAPHSKEAKQPQAPHGTGGGLLQRVRGLLGF